MIGVTNLVVDTPADPLVLLAIVVAIAAAGVMAYFSGFGSAAGGPKPPLGGDGRHAIPVGPSPALIVGPSPSVLIAPSAAPTLTVYPSTDLAVVVGPQSPPPILVSPRRPEIVVAPAPVATIKPPPRGTWEERGWTRHGIRGREAYDGQYEITERTSGQRRRFPGRIEMHQGIARPFVANLPDGIQRHPKWPCFHQAGKSGWFEVNWAHPARHGDEAILYVERVLDEVVNTRRI
jgi:hypothetical protein